MTMQGLDWCVFCTLYNCISCRSNSFSAMQLSAVVPHALMQSQSGRAVDVHSQSLEYALFDVWNCAVSLH